MNNVRRKRIKDIINKIEIVKKELDDILSDEQYAYDNMSEGLQCSERGMNSEESIDLMEEACEAIDDAIDSLNKI